VFDGTPLGAGRVRRQRGRDDLDQARRRCHLTLPPAQARMMRVEHEDDRGGALA
jgi:hypothetical protein